MEIARGQFTKLDDERHLATGWAYVAKRGDDIVVDHSGDFIDDEALASLEDAAHDFMLTSREADDMHVRTEGVGKVVESFVFTPDKLDSLGMDSDRVGWGVTMKIEDDEVWEKIKSGERRMFSIRGRGRREPVDAG